MIIQTKEYTDRFISQIIVALEKSLQDNPIFFIVDHSTPTFFNNKRELFFFLILTPAVGFNPAGFYPNPAVQI